MHPRSKNTLIFSSYTLHIASFDKESVVIGLLCSNWSDSIVCCDWPDLIGQTAQFVVIGLLCFDWSDGPVCCDWSTALF